MTPSEIRALVETLRACGVTHFKEGELELNLGPAPSLPQVSDKEIEHKNIELTSLLKLTDTDLVDRLFPDHSKREDAEESAEMS